MKIPNGFAKGQARRACLFLAALILAGLAVVPGLADANGGGLANTPWPMFQHDQRHTGLSPYLGAQTNATKWIFNTGQIIRGTPVIGSDGTIYFSCWNGSKFYALNPDGSVKWLRYTLFGGVGAPAIGSNGTIYFSDYGQINAFHPADGSLKWSLNVDGIRSSPVIANDGTIYCGANLGDGAGCLYAIRDNGGSGSVKWSYPTGLINYSAPALGNGGTIYIGTYDTDLYAVTDNGTNGVLKWRFNTAGVINSSPSIGSDGTVYVGSDDGALYAITDNVTNAVQKWRFDTGWSISSSPAIGNGGTIYVGCSAAAGFLYTLFAMNPNGSLKWAYDTGSDAETCSPAIGSDGTIYIGNGFGNRVWAISDNGTSGILKWSYLTGSWVLGSPAIGSDGTVYIGSYDTKLYAFSSSPSITAVNPNSGIQGQTLNNIIITGTNFTNVTDVSFGTGIAVSPPVTDNSTQIRVNLTIAAGAIAGARDVSVTTPDGTGTKTGAFTVLQPTQSVSTATGTGTATFTTSSGSITGLTAAASTACGTLSGFSFPHGFFSFTITGIPTGSTVTITITLPSNMPAGTQYWKCINGQWVDCTSLLGDNDGDNILTLTIRDGGLGDSISTPDGMIVDPGGPGVPGGGGTSEGAAEGAATGESSSTTIRTANLRIAMLNVNPTQAKANQPITIAANVVNDGSETGSTNVALKINGKIEQTKLVTVGGGGSRPVKFTVTKAEPGTYTVIMGSQRASFVVTGDGAKAAPALSEGTIAMLLLAVVVVAFVIIVAFAFRKRPTY